MTRAATRFARGAPNEKRNSTNVALVRGRLVSAPTIRLVERRQRVASFEVASVVKGRRGVVPVTAPASDLPAMKPGDEVTVLGHVRRRFFRVGPRTQSVTEIVAERIVLGSRSSQLDKVMTVMHQRTRELRATELPGGDSRT